MDRSRSPRFRPGDRVSYQSQYNEHGERVDETLYGTVVRTDSSGVEVQFDGYETTDGIPDDSELLEHAPSSSTPTSANSYSDADVRAQSVWQAEVSKMKVAQLDELLSAKGVKPRGVKAEKAMEVAWRYTKEEIVEWRAQQEKLSPPGLLNTPRPHKKTLEDYFF